MGGDRARPYRADAVAETGPGGLRERKKHKTAVALHEAAMDLFRERGYAETTVEDIAERADVSPRTFFRYFTTKESVVFADERVRRDIWVEALRSRPEDEPLLDSIREASLRLTEDYHQDKDFFRWELAAEVPAVAAARFRAHTRWESAIALEAAERLRLPSKNDLTARTLAAACLGAWRAAQTAWYFSRGRTRLATHVRHSYAVLDHLGALLPAVPVVDVRDPKEPRAAVTEKP
jgi:AcrR family transcriptional regulator